jgi:hypothetical protein
MILFDPMGTIVANIYPSCIRDDTDTRYVSYKNFNISIKNPTKDVLRYMIMSAGGEADTAYFPTDITISNMNFHDMYLGSLFTIYFVCRPLDTVVYTDSVHDNYMVGMFFMTATNCKSLTMERVEFKNIDGMQYQSLITQNIGDVKLVDITFRNYTGSGSPISPILAFADSISTNVQLDGLYVYD